jgi:membrane associated rhomboid family serine protease
VTGQIDGTDETVCYRHPGRAAGVRCQRCGRTICPDCMRTASVGFHCPGCTRTQGQTSLRGREIFALARNRAVVTEAIIAINVIVFVIDVATGAGLFGGGGLGDLTFDGGLSGFFVDQDGEWYRIFTSAFLHRGLVHIGFNMYLLWQLGRPLEQGLGRLRFLGLFGAALTAGSFGALIDEPFDLTVGASGAVFGLMGALLAAQRSNGMNVWQSGIGALILVNVIISIGVRSISLGGHLGGLVGGFIIGVALFGWPGKVRPGSKAVGWAAIGCVAAIGIIGSLWASTRWMDPLF